MLSRKPSSPLPRIQEFAVYLLIVGTLTLVAITDGLPWPTLVFCVLIAVLRMAGLTLSTNAGCALLVAVAAGAPVYWFFFRSFAALNVKDFLLAVLMVFLLSAQTGRDFAAVSSYCIWIMMASLFPSSGPQQWFILGILFAWFLLVQCLNELRRNRDQIPDWSGIDGWRLLRPLSSLAVTMVLGVGAVAVGLYVLLPRNPIAAFHFDFQPFRRLVGFSGSVRLGEIGQLQDDRTPAFRVRFLQGIAPSVIRWRGVALGDFNGSAWTNSSDGWSESRQQGKISIASDEQRRKPGERIYFEVQTLAAMDRVLFSVGVPEFVYLPSGRLRMNAEGSLRQIALDNSLPTYLLSGWIGQNESHPVSSDATATLSEERRLRYVRLPYQHPRIRELAQQLAAGAMSPYDIALRYEAHLRTAYAYSLDANISSRDPLVDFLFNARAGHCEYFASAMAVMLRTMRIPARVVTGFYSSLPEPIGPWHVIRSSSAHSWVEVWIEKRGWVVFDPTPPGSNQPKLSALTQWFLRMQDRFVVMSEEWMGGAGGLKRPTIPRFEWDWRWLALPVLLGALVLVWRYRPTRPDARHEATRLYRRYLAAARSKRLPSQTARELPNTSRQIVATYERARFNTNVVGGDGGPAWSDVVVIVPWTIYRTYGNLQILEDAYDSMARYLQYLEDTAIDGIRSHPEWNGFMGFGDWLSINADTPNDLIGTAFFAHVAHLMAKIADVLGKAEDVAKYQEVHERIKAAFQGRFVTPTGQIAGRTQTAYLLALHFQLLQPEHVEVAVKDLVRNIRQRGTKLSTGFVGSPYLNHVLTDHGQHELAFDLLQQKEWPSWLYAVTQGATTIWERWDGWTHDKGFQDAGMNSFNHYAYGAIGDWMYQRIAGIDLDPEVPAYKKLRMRPLVGGGLTWAHGTLETRYGTVESRWELDGDAFHWNVEIPFGTTASVELPAGFTAPEGESQSREIAAGKHVITGKRAS